MALALTSLRTPGVYVEEVSLLPPSVAAVETAIPAFIGYTEIAKDDFGGDAPQPYLRRIVSMLEYEKYFGKAPNQQITITVANNDPSSVAISKVVYNMHYAMQMYFANGGGPCFIVSVGNYADTSSQASYSNGINALNDVDEPTLLVLPDAVNLASSNDYHNVLTDALLQCEIRGDRFLVCDIYNGDKTTQTDLHITGFRDGIGNNSLKYAAAYYPWLQTSLVHQYGDHTITFKQEPNGILNDKKLVHIRALLQADAERVKSDQANEQAAAAVAAAEAKDYAQRAARSAVNAAAIIRAAAVLDGIPVSVVLADAASKAQLALNSANSLDLSTDTALEDAKKIALDAVTAADSALAAASLPVADLPTFKSVFTAAFENKMQQFINEKRVVMPPSPAIAGVYVSVDNRQGVWKAPANVSLNRVIKPMVIVNDESQRNLNVHDSTGKSINAIRAFTGKGILVWGARTLDGFSNEWRYVPVRRLFNMVEESLKKATSAFIFEPNDANLWVKVKAMCENFLTQLWRQGALAGAKPEDAFQVRVGLGITMTAENINNGQLIVEVLMAPVRPAEFIVLRFMHKLQVS